jgi:hypothetical protein
MMRLLHYLRDLDLPDNETGKSSNAFDDITALWRRVFGDPDEWERKMAERNNVAELVENETARNKREREEHVRKNLFR